MWQFKSYIRTCFFGQEEVITGVHYLVDDVEEGNNHNFLFRAPSGYGKTFLARRILYFLYLKTDTRSHISFTGDKYKYYPDRRFQLIDEVHLLKDTERIYPAMDSGRHTFMLMTNEYSELLEPLVNRCVVLDFTGYSREELAKVAFYHLRKHNFVLSDNELLAIVDNSRMMPREIINLCNRLLVLFRQRGKPNTVEEMEDILFNYAGIKQGGFTALDLAYLELLRKQGRASLNTIARVLQIPKQAVLNEVEPFLMRKELVRIGSRGRTLNNGGINADQRAE